MTATISGRVKNSTQLLAIEVSAELYDRYREVRAKMLKLGKNQDDLVWLMTLDGLLPLDERHIERTLTQLEEQLERMRIEGLRRQGLGPQIQA